MEICQNICSHTTECQRTQILITFSWSDMHIFNRQNVCLLRDTDTIEFVEKQTTFSEKYELHR